jgi:toxin-antitoxin system PIN domain toxin
VIIVDANLLLFAYDSASPHQAAAAGWLERTIAEEEVGLAHSSVLAFLRIGTHPSVFARPMSRDDVFAVVQSWFDEPSVRAVNPTAQHWTVMRDLATRGQAKGPLLIDAHLAALAIEHGATLCSVDRDFARFPGLRFVDPIS